MKTLLLKPKTASLVANGFSALIAITSFSLLTRLFNAEELTYWTFFLSLSALYTSLNQGLVDQYFIKRWNELKTLSDRSELIGAAWSLSLIVSALALIILLIIYTLIHFYSNIYLQKELIMLITMFILFDTPFRIGLCKLKANMEFNRILKYKVLVQALFFSAVIFLFYLNKSSFKTGENYWNVGIFYIMVRFLVSALAVYFGDSGINKVKFGTKHAREEMMRFGRFAVGTQVVSSFLADSDFYLVQGMKGSVLSSVFAVAKRCLPLIGLATNSIAQVSYTKIAGVFGTNMIMVRREFHRELGILILLVWPVCVFAYIMAGKFIYVIGGSDYQDSVPVFRAMIISMFLLPIDKMIGIGLNVFNMPNMNFRKMIIILVINIVGDILVLYFGGGLVGVAYITILASSTGVLYSYFYMRKVVSISLPYALKEGWASLRSLRR